MENLDPAAEMVAAGKPFIACFWHGRMLMIRHGWRFEAPMSILISHHRDGRFISRTLELLGIGTIAGSSSRGGDAAFRQMLRTLSDGAYVGVTPDGPRGPRMRAKAGVIRAAQLSGAPLVPVSFGVSRRRVLDSWDRFVLPLPFARGEVRLGDPISVPRDANDEEQEAKRRELEETLNALTEALDREFGHDPVAPGDARSARAKRSDAPAT